MQRKMWQEAGEELDEEDFTYIAKWIEQEKEYNEAQKK